MSKKKTIKLNLRHEGKAEPFIYCDNVVLSIDEYEDLKALAADRLEMNKELEAAALKVLRTSLDRLKLLRRIEWSDEFCHYCDGARDADILLTARRRGWGGTQIGHTEDCELAEELGDD